jgi:hypothetical protein
MLNVEIPTITNKDSLIHKVRMEIARHVQDQQESKPLCLQAASNESCNFVFLFCNAVSHVSSCMIKEEVNTLFFSNIHVGHHIGYLIKQSSLFF